MRSFQVGRIFGFPIKVNLSFLILLGAVWLWFGGLPGVALMAVAFTSVVAHELGHALVARQLGVRTKEIELGFLGGAAKILDLPRRPGDEIAIAAAGPAVSFALAGLSYAVASLLDSSALAWVAIINLGIGLFNLVPALPMDGGRILRALLSMRMGYGPATRVAVKVARGLALVLGGVGLVTLHLQLVAVAFFVWLASGAELRASRFVNPYADHETPVAVEYIPPQAWPPKPQPPFARGPVRVVVFRT